MIVPYSVPDLIHTLWSYRILYRIDPNPMIVSYSVPDRTKHCDRTVFCARRIQTKGSYTILCHIHADHMATKARLHERTVYPHVLTFFLSLTLKCICILIPYPPWPTIYVSSSPRWLFLSDWTLYVFFIFPMRATGPAYFLFLDLTTLRIIIIIIFKEYMLWCSCSVTIRVIC
jgi:hypothetical protein